MNYLLSELFSGGLMLGAWFMATDYVTSPITQKGQYVYGICLGIVTGVFRLFGASAEGVSYAIIFCNLLVRRSNVLPVLPPLEKEGKNISYIQS